VHANISLTLIDVLTTLPIIRPSAFPDAVEKVANSVSFDQDVKIQVFELTIRALGSLLSTYQYLERLPDHPKEQAKQLGLKGKVHVKKHKGKMLELAYDLGTRLLPAFDTPTGLPYSRVDLRHGVLPGESQETCGLIPSLLKSRALIPGAAGAGSLILEFALLSRLTGDGRFEVSSWIYECVCRRSCSDPRSQGVYGDME
jgi:mannosidase alpha-like ER degradation enhancer 1